MLLDYVRGYGGQLLDNVPVNYVDLCVLSELSTLDWPETCWRRPLTDAVGAAVLPAIPKNALPLYHDEHRQLLELQKLVAEAPRYGAFTVSRFACSFEKGQGQFGALALNWEDVTVIAFRATDETLTGWEEALRLSLDVPRFAQRQAEQFATQVLNERPDGPVILCGHSKGGNLAQYAASTCCGSVPHLPERIATIVSFDGPGLSTPQRDTTCYASMAPDMVTFIPASSFIGHINEHPQGAIHYVASTGHFVGQHDTFTWKTDGTHFVTRRQSVVGQAGETVFRFLVKHLNDKQKGRLFDTALAVPMAVARGRSSKQQ